MIQNNDLYHHGIPGQKWGIRRYQNKDGSLTPLGRKRADKLEEKYKKITGRNIKKELDRKEEARPKKISEMTSEELQRRTNRLNTEKNYLEAVRNRSAVEPQKVSRGKSFVKAVWNDAIRPAATNAGKDFLEKYLKSIGDDILGINNNSSKKKTQKVKK